MLEFVISGYDFLDRAGLTLWIFRSNAESPFRGHGRPTRPYASEIAKIGCAFRFPSAKFRYPFFLLTVWVKFCKIKFCVKFCKTVCVKCGKIFTKISKGQINFRKWIRAAVDECVHNAMVTHPLRYVSSEVRRLSSLGLPHVRRLRNIAQNRPGHMGQNWTVSYTVSPLRI